MSVSNISNNNTTQLQVYAQEKNIAAAAKTEPRNAPTEQLNRKDSVQISERARALLEKDSAVTTQGNGGGIIPPGNAPVTGSTKDTTVTTLGNGGGIIPPGN